MRPHQAQVNHQGMGVVGVTGTRTGLGPAWTSEVGPGVAGTEIELAEGGVAAVGGGGGGGAGAGTYASASGGTLSTPAPPGLGAAISAGAPVTGCAPGMPLVAGG
jgi:hypothetical protein